MKMVRPGEPQFSF